MATISGIRSHLINETPFSVIDFETTGLRPGSDRVVEVSVVRKDPGRPPRLVFDTLVNPCRSMAATDVHGITAEDVADAPTFADIAGEVAKAISGTVVSAYNVYFDMPFLQYELSAAGRAGAVPHLCVMYLRPMLGIGSRCGLDEACGHHQIVRTGSHIASADALAAAEVLGHCMGVIDDRGIRTFGDLAKLKDYRFLSSFDLTPMVLAETIVPSPRLRSRTPATPEAPPARPTAAVEKKPLAHYWNALLAVLADLEVTSDEVLRLAQAQADCQLTDGTVRALHARAYAQVLMQFAEDKVLDDAECSKLHRLHECLGRLGWAPGQPNFR